MKRNLFLSVLFVLMFAPAHAQQVNILSYNVHNCIGMDKEYNYRRIANVISQTSPDIVALQELDSVTVRNKGIHALGELEKLTGMHGLMQQPFLFRVEATASESSPERYP
jgi:endonuclease/exonuclease/phosphatase family metal-dependent hydrolase